MNDLHEEIDGYAHALHNAETTRQKLHAKEELVEMLLVIAEHPLARQSIEEWVYYSTHYADEFTDGGESYSMLEDAIEAALTAARQAGQSSPTQSPNKDVQDGATAGGTE